MRFVKIIFIKKIYSYVYIGKIVYIVKKKLLMYVFIKKIKLRVEFFIFNLKNLNS